MAHDPLTSDLAESTARLTPRRLATLVVILLIIANAGYSILHEWTCVKPLDRFDGKPWTEFTYVPLAERYQQLRIDLTGVGEVGFISGFPYDTQAHRMMAQSMLAPTLIATNDKPAVVIASFENDAELDRWLANPLPDATPLIVRHRLGNGLALLERARR